MNNLNVCAEAAVEGLWGGAFGVVGGLMEGPVKAVAPPKFLKESKKVFL